LLVKEPPSGDGWIHEVKLDGFRMGCRVDGGHVQVLSRLGNEWTSGSPEVVAAVASLGARSLLLDGELAAVTPDGRTSMGFGRSPDATMAYFVFDLLHLDGEDLMPLPVEQRKARLRALVGERPPAPIRYLDHVVGGGRAFFDEACRLGIEGIVSKDRRAPYRPGARNASWQKTKCVLRQELVIGGYEESVVGSLGAIWLGYYDAVGALVFAGKVGTGFQREARALLAAFQELVIPAPPFASGLPKGHKLRGARWLQPRLVCEVAFMEWTGHGHIRHPSFRGLRPDKDPRTVVREVPVRPGPDDV
jgi:bifunctional non-homologous end joining protein LigD